MNLISFYTVCLRLLVVAFTIQAKWIRHDSGPRQRVPHTQQNIERYLRYLNDFDIFYVDQRSGEDSYDGQSPWRHGDGTKGPFKTIVGAIENIRRYRMSISMPAKLFIRSGFYSIKEPIRLTAKDSNLEILAYPFDNERPVLSGAVRIWGGNFRPVHMTDRENWIYEHEFEGVCSGHLFINGKRMVRARKPNLYKWTGDNMAGEGPFLVIEDLLLASDDCNRESFTYHQNCLPRNKAGFQFREGDFAKNITNVEDVQIVVFNAWTAERQFVQKIAAGRKVYFQKLLRQPIGRWPRPSGWRYIIENSLEELDDIGEYYCDPSRKKLYIIPPDKNFMSNDVYIGSNSHLFRGIGASNISLNGLEFMYTHDNFVTGYNSRPGLLEFENCTGVTVSHNIIAHIGYNAIVFAESRNAMVHGNQFYDIGNYAVYISNPRKGKSVAPKTQDIEISNNTATGCGVYHMMQSGCIHVRGVHNIRVIGNEISRTPYAGIKVGWQKAFSPRHTNISKPVFYIAENHITQYGSAILSDFAGVYLSTNMRDCGLLQNMNKCHLHAVITRNVIHYGTSYSYGAAGVYSDTASSSVTVTDNWIYDVGGPSINFHCGQNNVATNNMIVHVNSNRVFGTCNHATPNGDRPRQFFSMKYNVIYVENPEAMMYRNGDGWDFDVPYLNWNLYSGMAVRSKNFFPKGFSINQWRKETRNDMDSRIVNPKFSNRLKRILTLRRSSPARSLGIRSVDLLSVLNGESTIWMFRE